MNSLPAPTEPHNREAEEAVLGSILMNQANFFEVSFLSPEDFYIHRNGWIFQAFKNLIEKNIPVDALTICDELGPKLQEAGGSARISELLLNTPTSMHVKAYAKMVEEHAIRRRMLGAASEIAAMAHDSQTELNALLAGAEHKVRGACTSRKSEDKIADALDAASEFVELIHSERLCIPTGIPRLDYLVGGLELRKQTILGGRPMKGKTALAFQMAQNVALSGRTVLFFSLEMDRPSLLARRVCGIEGVDWRDIIAKRASPDDLLRVEKRAVEYGHKMQDRLLIDDNSARTSDAIYRLTYKYHPDLIITDHVSLIAKNETGQNMNYLVGKVSWALKAISKEFNCASLVLCQLSRYRQRQAQMGEGDGEPELIDLRDSGELEQNADNVWFLHYKDCKADEKPPTVIEAALIVKKFRAGQANMKCNLIFDLKKQWFDSKSEQQVFSRAEMMEPPESDFFDGYQEES